VGVLKQNGALTVFAPNNAAFDKLTAGTLNSLLQPRNKNQLKTLLSYHVVPGRAVYSKDLQTTNTLTTFNGQALQVQKLWNAVFVSASASSASPAQVIAPDNSASNGVLHIIDTILMPQSMPQPPPPATRTIVDVVGGMGLSTLTSALQAADLTDNLRAATSGSQYTVFAPTNSAFNKLSSGALNQLLQPTNKVQLVSILKNHVILGTEYTKDLMAPAQKTLRTLANGYVSAAINSAENRQTGEKWMEIVLTVGNTAGRRARIVSPDNVASNGVVHSIDTVLMFPEVQQQQSDTIVDMALTRSDLTTFVSALYAADLGDSLNGNGPFTVFAPGNAAFGKLSSSLLSELLQPTNKNQLASILMYHVISGAAVESRDLLAKNSFPTLGGQNLEVQKTWNGVFLSTSPSSAASARVVDADNRGSNGVVHIIDTVLQPLTQSASNPSSQGATGLCTCGTWVDGRVSCCASGGSWFGKCGKRASGFAHSWVEGMRACKGVNAMRQKRNFSFEVNPAQERANAVKPIANIASELCRLPKLIVAISFALTVFHIQL